MSPAIRRYGINEHRHGPFIPKVHHVGVVCGLDTTDGGTTDAWADVTCPACLRAYVPEPVSDLREIDRCAVCGGGLLAPAHHNDLMPDYHLFAQRDSPADVLLAHLYAHALDGPLNQNTPKDNTPMTIPFTMTQDTITVILDGTPHTVQAGTPQYHGLRDCIFTQNWADIAKHVTVGGALQQWLGDKFVVEGQRITFDGVLMPESMTRRIWALAAAGESPAPLFAFYERLARNPSYRSVEQLFTFLAHLNIPLQPDGTFLAYKGVRPDFLDAHSGTLLNTPGTTQRMPRNQISDDPRTPCHKGLHVGALSYAQNFASRVVIVQVDPEHVVCVPYDASQRKMRVCEYTVIGEYGEQPLASTVVAAPVDTDEEWTGDVDDPDADGELSETDKEVRGAEAAVDNGPAWVDEADDEADEPSISMGVQRDRMITPKPAKKPVAFARMNPSKLMEQGIDELRKYASAHLKIVGASKLPGGKSALVAKIMKARKRR